MDWDIVLSHLDGSPIPHVPLIQLLHGSRNALYGQGKLLQYWPDVMFGSESQHRPH